MTDGSIVGACCLLFIGCKEEQQTNFQLERENLLGDWDVAAEFTELVDGMEVNDFFSQYNLDINDDGTAVLRSFIVDSLFWYYQAEPKTILLLSSSFGPNVNFYTAGVYDVVENSRDRHVWKFQNSYRDSVGVEVVGNTLWTLTRR